MYEAYFGLHSRPFAATPVVEAFVPLPGPADAIAAIEQTVVDASGIAVLTGPAGSGKTLAGLALADRLRDRLEAVYVPSASCGTRRALLQALLHELGETLVRVTDDELRLHLVNVIRNRGRRSEAVVFVIDEAHRLSGEMLEDLRRLTHVVDDGRPLVRLVLAGRLELEERLAEPGRDDFNQRIACHRVLERLTRSESRQYLAGRIQHAGGSLESLFDEEAIGLVCEIADGLPRCLNQLADHALLLAYVDERQPVDAEVVLEAFEDLKQLPLQWNEPLSTAGDPGLVANDDSWTASETVAEPDLETEPSAAVVDDAVADDDGEPSPIEFVDRTAARGSEPKAAPEPATPESASVAETGRATVVEVGWSGERTGAGTPTESEPGPSRDASSSAEAAGVSGEASVVETPGSPVTEAAAPSESFPFAATTSIDVMTNQEPIDWVEEYVVDRYAFLDAGREPASVPTFDVRTERAGEPGPVPVATLEPAAPATTPAEPVTEAAADIAEDRASASAMDDAFDDEVREPVVWEAPLPPPYGEFEPSTSRSAEDDLDRVVPILHHALEHVIAHDDEPTARSVEESPTDPVAEPSLAADSADDADAPDDTDAETDADPMLVVNAGDEPRADGSDDDVVPVDDGEHEADTLPLSAAHDRPDEAPADSWETRIAEDVRALRNETQRMVSFSEAEREVGRGEPTRWSDAYDTVEPEEDARFAGVVPQEFASEPEPRARRPAPSGDRPYARLFSKIRERYERERRP